MSKREKDKLIQEIKERMGIAPQKEDKCLCFLGILLGVLIAVTIGLILWLRSKELEDIEEYYEYFDDEVLKDDIYGEEDLDFDDEEVEYLEITNFDETEEE